MPSEKKVLTHAEVKDLEERVDFAHLGDQWNDCQAGIADRSAQFKVMVEYVRFRNFKPLKFMELCAGAGCQSEALLSAFPDSEVTVFEANPFFQGMARHVLKRMTNNLQIVGSDMRMPGWHKEIPGSFDLIVSADALTCFSKDALAHVYSGIRSLLKPDGVFINCDYILPSDDQVQALSREIKRNRNTEESRTKWDNFWNEAETAIGIPGYRGSWLSDLSSDDNPGIDGFEYDEHRSLLKAAGFKTVFTLWQSYGDCVYGASC